MDALSDIEVFVRVADLGSFTAAARSLDISTSYASRRVRALEDRLGVRLLERTTRKVRLTQAGRAYHERVAPLLDGLDEAAREAASLRAEPRGTLRIAAPAAFGRRYLIAPMVAFMEQWPELRVEASFDDRAHDLIAEGFDLAIRGGRLTDENLVARRLLGFQGVFTASPAYLARRGTPVVPEDLLNHACILNLGLRSMPGWAYVGPEGEVSLDVQGPLAVDDGDASIAAAEAGLGISYEPDFIAWEGLCSGRLVRLLPGVQTYDGAFYALYPHRRHLPAKVRLFIDHLAEAWKVAPWAEQAIGCAS